MAQSSAYGLFESPQITGTDLSPIQPQSYGLSKHSLPPQQLVRANIITLQKGTA